MITVAFFPRGLRSRLLSTIRLGWVGLGAVMLCYVMLCYIRFCLFCSVRLDVCACVRVRGLDRTEPLAFEIARHEWNHRNLGCARKEQEPSQRVVRNRANTYFTRFVNWNNGFEYDFVQYLKKIPCTGRSYLWPTPPNLHL